MKLTPLTHVLARLACGLWYEKKQLVISYASEETACINCSSYSINTALYNWHSKLGKKWRKDIEKKRQFITRLPFN
uniref:Uncharacterized protein n=1 Tax=Anguilla anguilla TaxID=7936 RepID=A0A0E9PHC3_ANGAN